MAVYSSDDSDSGDDSDVTPMVTRGGARETADKTASAAAPLQAAVLSPGRPLTPDRSLSPAPEPAPTGQTTDPQVSAEAASKVEFKPVEEPVQRTASTSGETTRNLQRSDCRDDYEECVCLSAAADEISSAKLAKANAQQVAADA